MKLDLILRVTTKLILPFMLLFALYVQLHGDFGPGGGFQAGVIAAGMIILYSLVFGLRAAQRVIPMSVVMRAIPLGVLIYLGVGVVAMMKGGAFLNYSTLASHAEHGQHTGILLVELGVLVTVASTMVGIFYAFVERGR